MCHDNDSRPPAPPIVRQEAGHHPLTLTAADGNTFSAHLAIPSAPNGSSVVILPDVRGLHPYYEQLAVRFAEAGFHAIAVDYFGRTLGVGRREEVPDWQALIAQVRSEHIEADVGAAVTHLSGMGAGPTFTVGFCFGGGHSWRLAASDLDLAGCIGFYGRPATVADVEADIHRPLLLLVAGSDQATPVADFHAFSTRLTRAGKAHTMVVYDGAPHSFFDRAFRDWAPACADAWQQILDFTQRNASS
jgi:carboxymethylenebutenolidase